MSQPALKTDRLLLRPFTQDDAAAVRHLAGDARIADTTTEIPHPYPAGAAEAWISTHGEEYAAGISAIYAITLRDNGKVIGAIAPWTFRCCMPGPSWDIGWAWTTGRRDTARRRRSACFVSPMKSSGFPASLPAAWRGIRPRRA